MWTGSTARTLKRKLPQTRTPTRKQTLRKSRRDAAHLLSRVCLDQLATVREEDAEGLPDPVQRHLHRAGVFGQPWTRSVRSKQGGRFRLGPDRPWVRFLAEQVHVVPVPGFVWFAKIEVAPLLTTHVEDSSVEGQGHLEARLGGLWPVAHADDADTDAGELVRWLSVHPEVEVAFTTGSGEGHVPHEAGLEREAAAYCLALPHGVAARYAETLRRARPNAAVIDLSGDLRLPTEDAYRKWYAHDRPAGPAPTTSTRLPVGGPGAIVHPFSLARSPRNRSSEWIETD